MFFQSSEWDADVPNFPSAALLGKKRKKKAKSNQSQSNIQVKSQTDQQTQNQLTKQKFKSISKTFPENQGNRKKNNSKHMSFDNNIKSEKKNIESPKFSIGYKSKLQVQPNVPKTKKNQNRLNTESNSVKHIYSELMNSNDKNKSEKFSKAVKMQSKKEYAQSVSNSTLNIRSKQNLNKIKNTRNVFSENIFEENRKKSKQKPLRQRMLEKLKGARFRYINEQLYLSEGKEAKSYFKDDPLSYEAYHEGYRQQVSKWPLNPLDIIIDNILKLPKDKIIADFGCGDAKLANSVPHKVKSFDLVSNDPAVIECDMAHTPLLASEVDIAVFCLSLMGTNLNEYLIEANRVLKEGGVMKIAEVESRFEKIDDFIKEVGKFGFKLIKKDLSNDLFYFVDFKKERDIGKRGKKNLPEIKLRPCLYKKR